MYFKDLLVTLHCISYIHTRNTGVTDVTVTDVTSPYLTSSRCRR